MGQLKCLELTVLFKQLELMVRAQVCIVCVGAMKKKGDSCLTHFLKAPERTEAKR